jgi:protocatechuate 3,4-dioxygenase beta subunit
MNYMDDFRDPALKINDDKKIQIQLGAFKEKGTSIFLFIREFDTTGKPVREGDFDRAWFRLSNEETNQTLDYSLVKNIEKSEEYQATIPAEDDDSPPTLNPLSYLHGRLFLNDHGNWVFESMK